MAKKTTKKSTTKASNKKTNNEAKKKVAAKSNSKAKKKAAPKKKADTDKFGFRKTSKKSQAAALYATKKGATLSEVKEKTGSAQLNLLKELEDKGYTINKTKEEGKGKKPVTRYKIVT